MVPSYPHQNSILVFIICCEVSQEFGGLITTASVIRTGTSINDTTCIFIYLLQRIESNFLMDFIWYIMSTAAPPLLQKVVIILNPPPTSLYNLFETIVLNQILVKYNVIPDLNPQSICTQFDTTLITTVPNAFAEAVAVTSSTTSVASSIDCTTHAFAAVATVAVPTKGSNYQPHTHHYSDWWRLELLLVS